MAQEASPYEIADGKLRCLLAHTQSFGRADVAAEDSALFYETVSRESPAATWPGCDSGYRQSWVSAQFQWQTLKVARYSACRKVEPKGLGEVEWNPASGWSEGMGARPSPDERREDASN